MKLHECDVIRATRVGSDGYVEIYRVSVEGGWLYSDAEPGSSWTYVPDPTAAHVRYAADPWEEARDLAKAAGYRWHGGSRWMRGDGMIISVVDDVTSIVWSMHSDIRCSTPDKQDTAPTPADAMRAALAAAAEVAP